MNHNMLLADFDCLSDAEFFDMLQSIVEYADRRFPGLTIPAMLSLRQID